MRLVPEPARELVLAPEPELVLAPEPGLVRVPGLGLVPVQVLEPGLVPHRQPPSSSLKPVLL